VEIVGPWAAFNIGKANHDFPPLEVTLDHPYVFHDENQGGVTLPLPQTQFCPHRRVTIVHMDESESPELAPQHPSKDFLTTSSCTCNYTFCFVHKINDVFYFK
jgi:hypothetical protein